MEAFNSSLPFPFSYPIITSATSCTTSSFNDNAAGSGGSISSTWMDSMIWSQLPQTLIDRIIAFLPPPAFFRARSVCKRWYGLLFSTSFLQLYLHVSPCHRWFLFFNHKAFVNSYIYRNHPPNHTKTVVTSDVPAGTDSCEGYLFDPYTFTWYRLFFPLIPSCYAPVSSSGGLICWTSNESGPKCLILHNPLIGSVSQLPQTIRPRLFPSIGLNVTPSSVDIIVAGDDMISPYAVKNLTAETFHIDAGGFYSLWGTGSSLPRLCSLESGQMKCVGGKFYSMNYSPFSVLAYDVAANLWSKIQAPMRRFLRSPSLIENQGKLMLVAAVEKSKLNVPKSLRMWRLLECGTIWVEMERMPQQLYIQFEEIEGGKGFECVGNGEFIVIMIKGSSKYLLFDFSWKRWSWVPPCPFIHVGDAQLHGFAYEPKLATPVTGLLDHLTLPFQSFHA
uniref:F-box domain-containing protein n=1 Tax=Kalanchoe fedtschenkoi TaxID=63787 RepID=A0A7N0T7B1_KALFE